MLTSRYENKYILPEIYAEDFRRYIAPYVRRDEHAPADNPLPQYLIYSMYFDSPDLKLYQHGMEGLKNRFKLRARYYDDSPDSPMFFEIKRRLNRITHKSRSKIFPPDSHNILSYQSYINTYSTADNDLSLFMNHCNEIQARPLINIIYQREAYEVITGEPVRITLDTNVSYSIINEGCDLFSKDDLIGVDMGGIILEIKFTDRFPVWVQTLIESFGLNRRSISKYNICLNNYLQNNPDFAYKKLRGICI